MNIKDLILRAHESIRDNGPQATVTISLPYEGKQNEAVRVYGKDSPEGKIISSNKGYMIVQFKAQDILNFVGQKKLVIAI